MNRRALLGSGFAIGVAGLAGVGMEAQRGSVAPQSSNPLIKEFKKQTRANVAKLKRGDPEAARATVAMLSLWAAQIESSGVDQALTGWAKKYGRNPGPVNHAMMEREAKEMGADLAGLSVHVTPNPKFAGRAYQSLVRGERLSARLRAAAAEIERQSKKWPVNGFLVAQLGDNGDPNNYRNCPVCAAAEGAWDGANYICGIAAAVALIPGANVGAAEACGAAMAAWMALESACQASRLFGC